MVLYQPAIDFKDDLVGIMQGQHFFAGGLAWEMMNDDPINFLFLHGFEIDQ